MKHFCSFSEAIREGAKIRPQAFFGYVRGGGTCALGAGLEAILDRPLSADECATKEGLRSIVQAADFWNRYHYLRTETVAPCDCRVVSGFREWGGGDNTSTRLDNLIVHLNNDHKWTREQIADWLESEEEKLGFVTISESPVEAESSESVLVSIASK